MATELFSTYSHLLDRTARKVKQYAQRRFNAANYDITVDQWLIIKNLNNNNDLNQSQLAEITGKDHPTLTRIIDLLCKKGLTERKIQANDRRCFTIHLTELGIQRVSEWEPNMAEIRMRAWQNLTEEDYKNLKRILDTIYTNLDEQEKLLTEF
jgi:DNA-binding MarR family transcriptional regulator